MEVWTEDETRLGLKPITRRVWAPKGHRPVTNGQTRYHWLYVYGFVRPKTGQLFRVFMPRVKTELMSQALLEFAATADPYHKKLLVLVVDNAGWHVSKTLDVPNNVVLYRLPPCTPELQPIEPLWPLLARPWPIADFAISAISKTSSAAAATIWPSIPRSFAAAPASVECSPFDCYGSVQDGINCQGDDHMKWAARLGWTNWSRSRVTYQLGVH